MRQFHSRCILVGVFLILHVSTSYSQWTQKSTGLNGGNVLTLLENGNSLIAGTNGSGVFISNDNGDSWAASSKGLSRMPVVTSLAKMGSVLFAGLYSGGVYTSKDNGATWAPLSATGAPQWQITSLHVSGNTLFAGSVNGLFSSDDLGVTWMARNTGLPAQPWVNSVISTPTSLIVSISFKGLYRSNDNGATWQALPGIPANADIGGITIHDGTIFAGATNSGIYRSVNNGDSWTLVGGLTLKIFYSLSYIGNVLFAGTFDSGLHISVNNGDNWSSVNLGRTNSVSEILAVGSKIFIATSGGIYRSADGGVSWSTANNKLEALSITSIETANEKVLLGANFSNGLFISTNQASTWASATVPQTSKNTASSCVYIKNDTLIGSAGGPLKISTNGGVSWSNYSSNSAHSILINKGDVFSADGGPLKVYKKNGSSWTTITNGISANAIMVSLGRVGSTLFAGTLYGYGVLRSKDNGVSWSAVNTGLPTMLPTIYGMYASHDKLFIVTSENGIYVSRDLGDSWALHPQAFNGFINDITFYNGIGFMANGDGVLYSLDNGETWLAPESSVPSYVSPLSVSCNSNSILAGTSSGVWELPLSTFSPTLSSFAPASGEVGSAVTIYGTNFLSREFLKVKFNGVEAEILASSSSDIAVKVPAAATTGVITVEVYGKVISSIESFCVKPPKPILTADLSDASHLKLKVNSEIGIQWFFNDAILLVEPSPTIGLVKAGSYYAQITMNGCSSLPSDVYCFNIPKPIITQDNSNVTQPVLTSNGDAGNQWFRNGVLIGGAINKILMPDKSGSYAVTTTAFGCTSPLSDAVAMIITGIMDAQKKELSSVDVYPSPTTDYITINLEKLKGKKLTLEIYDIMGRSIKSINNIQDSFITEDVSHYPAGVYLIKAVQIDGVFQARFSKY